MPNILGPAGAPLAAPREIGSAEWAHLADRLVEAIRSSADTGHPRIEGAWPVAVVSGAVRRSGASGASENLA